MKISNIASIISCVNAIPLHIFIHCYDRKSTVTVANSALPTVEDTAVEDTTVEDATVEDATVTPTTDTPAYYEFTTRTHDFDPLSGWSLSGLSGWWSTSIPAHQNKETESTPNSHTVPVALCNIL